jgi:Tetratricopeptide repeat
VLSDQGKYEQAEEIHRQVLRLRETVLGKEHPDTLASMNNLAEIPSDQGKYEQAEEIHRQELRLCETVLGKEPFTLTSRKQRQECPRNQRWPLLYGGTSAPPFNKSSYPGIPGLGIGLGI